MKKYKFRQEFGISEEDATPVKEFTVQVYLNAEAIGERSIMKMFQLFSKNFTGLMEEENALERNLDLELELGDLCREDRMENGKWGGIYG